MPRKKKEPEPYPIIIEGMEDVIERDLAKHKAYLERAVIDKATFVVARSHEIKRKRHYRDQIGGGKFNDESLKTAINDIVINIRHFSDKVKLADDSIAHHTHIVDTLTEQLKNQYVDLGVLAAYRKKNATIN